MPFYEYRCHDCDHRFEKLQRINDPQPPCPRCSCVSVERIISTTAFRLKGKGWYETDFKQTNQRNLVNQNGGNKKTNNHKKDSTSSDKKGSDKQGSEKSQTVTQNISSSVKKTKMDS